MATSKNSQEATKAEHDDASAAKKVVIVDSIGSISSAAYDYLEAVDSGDDTIRYHGLASAGTATSVSEWRIWRSTTTSTTYERVYADADTNFDNEWDERENLTY